MKTITFALIALFSLCLVSCDAPKSENSAPKANVSTEPTPFGSHDVILDIKNNLQGNLWMTGEINDFRLYADGSVEFDDYPSAGKGLKAEKEKKPVTGKTEFARVKAIQDILASEDYKQLKPSYSRMANQCNGLFNRTIVSGAQTVKIPGWCGNEDPPEFPQALANLLQAVRDVKSTILKRKAYTP